MFGLLFTYIDAQRLRAGRPPQVSVPPGADISFARCRHPAARPNCPHLAAAVKLKLSNLDVLGSEYGRAGWACRRTGRFGGHWHALPCLRVVRLGVQGEIGAHEPPFLVEPAQAIGLEERDTAVAWCPKVDAQDERATACGRGVGGEARQQGGSDSSALADHLQVEDAARWCCDVRPALWACDLAFEYAQDLGPGHCDIDLARLPELEIHCVLRLLAVQEFVGERPQSDVAEDSIEHPCVDRSGRMDGDSGVRGHTASLAQAPLPAVRGPVWKTAENPR